MNRSIRSFTRRFPGELFLLGLIYLFLLKDVQNDSRMQGSLLLNAIATIAFIVLVAAAIYASWPRRPADNTAEPSFFPRVVIVSGLLASVSLSLGALIYQQYFYAGIGYHLTWVSFALVALCTLAFLIAMSTSYLKHDMQPVNDSRRTMWLPASILMALAVLAVIWSVEIASFPLLPGRADMLPLIQMAARSFIAGDPPYQMYRMASVTEHVTPVGYLPIMWLLYLPTELIGIDPRWISILAITLIVWLLFATLGRRTNAVWFVVLLTLVLNPYDILRHDLYLLPYLALLAVALYAFGANRWVLASIFFALVLSARQTAIVLIPFYMIVLAKQRGLRQAALHLALIAAISIIIIGPFLVWQRETLVYSIVGGTLRWSSTAATLDSSIIPQARQRAAEGLALPERSKGFGLAPAISLLHRMQAADQFAWMVAWAALYGLLICACLIWGDQPIRGLGLMGFGALTFVLFVAGDEVHYAREAVIVVLFLSALAYRRQHAMLVERT